MNARLSASRSWTSKTPHGSGARREGRVVAAIYQENSYRTRIRVGERDAARARADPVASPAESRVDQARRRATGVFVQVARRLQQDGGTVGRRTQAGCDRGVGRQPRARRGALRGNA